VKVRQRSITVYLRVAGKVGNLAGIPPRPNGLLQHSVCEIPGLRSQEWQHGKCNEVDGKAVDPSGKTRVG